MGIHPTCLLHQFWEFNHGHPIGAEGLHADAIAHEEVGFPPSANERGNVLGTSSYWRVWQEARPIGLPPDKAASLLGRRPYDLRHTCITNWLNAGVPVAEVARRAGNSPEVIHRRYEGCIDGHEELNNKKIEEAMGWT